MDKKELKVVIKQLVKESLVEIFAEMNLETIVEGVLSRKMKKSSRPIVESREEPEVQVVEPKEDMKRKIMDKLAISDTEWKNIYGDTLESGSPILDGDDDAGSRPELVSESQLERAGLMRDYSKFVK